MQGASHSLSTAEGTESGFNSERNLASPRSVPTTEGRTLLRPLETLLDLDSRRSARFSLVYGSERNSHRTLRRAIWSGPDQK